MARKDQHRRIADRLAQSHPALAKKLDPKSARRIVDKARADSRHLRATMKPGASESKSLAQAQSGKALLKDGTGAKAKGTVAATISKGGNGNDTLILPPPSPMAAMANSAGFQSQYEPLLATLIEGITEALVAGIEVEAEKMALLNSLLELDEAETLQYAAETMNSLQSGLGDSALAGGGLDGSASGVADSGDPDAMIQSSLDSLGMSGMWTAQDGGDDAGLASAGPAAVQAMPAEGPTTMAVAPGPVVTPVAPAESAQPAVIWTTPATAAEAGTPSPGDAATLASNAIPAAATEATSPSPADGESSATETRVIIVNPEDSGGPLSYTLSGVYPYTIEPGSTQVLTDKPSWLIEFDRGESFGPAKYNIGPGTYVFTATDKGWELYNTTFTVILDNSANDNPFHFITEGQVGTVEAGGTCTLTGKYAIVVSFDRGDGGEPCEKTCKSGTYRIGVDERTQLLDLIADPAARTGEPDKAATASR